MTHQMKYGTAISIRNKYRKMFIGGLNWETTDGQYDLVTSDRVCQLTENSYLDGLKEYMSQYGEVDACTIMRDPSGRSRGFAFLTYSNAASVAKVMSLTHHLDGKQVSKVSVTSL